MGEILQAAILPSSHPQEGKTLDLDKAIFIINMTQIIAKTTHSVKSYSSESLSSDPSLSRKVPNIPKIKGWKYPIPH